MKLVIIHILIIHGTIADGPGNLLGNSVDLPSFLASVTNLRNKLIDLLGNGAVKTKDDSLSKQDRPSAQELISQSQFENKRKEREQEKNSLFENMKAMPTSFSGDDYEYDHYYSDDEVMCECAMNHKVLDKSNGRIVGGSAAVPNTLPWQAFIRINKTFRCGGTILNKRFVLSAMHCFHGIVNIDEPGSSIIIGAGIHDLCVDPHIASENWQLTHVKKIHHQNNYVPDFFGNDIVILEVSKDFKMNDIVQRACLPHQQYPPGENCFVSGWGHDANKQSPCELQYVGMPIIEQSICRGTHMGQTFKEASGNELPDTQLCAGHLEGGKDACQGDSGGPLVATAPDGVVEVVGIVSWGINCAEKNSPGSYTNVFKYVDWITETIQPGNCNEDYHALENATETTMTNEVEPQSHMTTLSTPNELPSSTSVTAVVQQNTTVKVDEYASVAQHENTTIPNGCNYGSWLGNGYCDDLANTPECDHDNGDCCPKDPYQTEWKKYCKECICKSY